MLFILPVATLILWLLSKQDLSIVAESPLRSLGQITGLLGFILVGTSLFLSTKPLFLDKFFGGMDRALKIHHFLGSFAFILIITHPLFLVAEDLPNYAMARLYLLPSGDLTYTLGVISLYVMIFSFFWIVFIKLPYHFWKLTHQVLGLAFLLGGVHSLLIGSDLSHYQPLQAWITFFFILGMTSFLYSVFLFARFGPRQIYFVEKIERALDIVDIYLRPFSHNLSFKPGQFVYVSFRSKEIGGERHPITISSSPRELILRLSVKIAGDYTLRLAHLDEGTTAWVYGPYGEFGKNVFHTSDETQIWISGGIGVTPFLSFLRSLKFRPIISEVDFFYIFRCPEEGVFTKEIEEVTKDFPNMHFFPWCTKEKGRATIETFKPLIRNVSKTSVWLCGPTAMMESLQNGFVDLEITPEKIYTERFDM